MCAAHLFNPYHPTFSTGHVLHQLVSVALTTHLLAFADPFPAPYHAIHEYRVPNFILAFIPAEINPNTLNTMTAFAVCALADMPGT